MGYSITAGLWIGLAALALSLYSYCAKLLRRRRYMRANGCESPPRYPHWDPFLGYDLYRDDVRAMAAGKSFSVRQARFRRLGHTYKATAMGRDVIHTLDPQNIQSVLALNFENFGVGPIRQPVVEPFLGRGIFTSDGKDWIKARSLLKPIFARSQIGNFSALEKHVGRALALVPRDGTTIDLQPIFKKMFLDISTETIFGESTDALLPDSGNSTNAAAFLAAFDQAMRSMRTGKDLGIMSLLTGHRQSKNEVHAEVLRVVDGFIARAIKRREDKLGDVGDRTILIDEMLKQTEDRSVLRAQLLNVFAAARDTTAVALSDVFFQLARLPDIWPKLRTEVLAVREPLSFENLKSMRYLQNVLRESLRLLGPAGMSQRVCLADSILPTGGGAGGTKPVLALKGDMILINFHAMHHDPKVWGADATTFCPERWEAARPTWEYLPFLGGGRICPAQQMAMGQMSYMLARFVQEFSAIENRDPEESFVEEMKLLVQSRNGVQVAFQG